MIKIGMVMVDHAFSWKALWGVSALLKHIIIFFMGIYITWAFFKLFIKFCFYFADVVIDLTVFAFFFPLMLTLFVFKNSKSAEWITNMSSNITPKYFKNVIDSIVSLATVVITYVVIMVIIAMFFESKNGDSAAMTAQIMDGSIYAGDLADDNLAMVTLGGFLVLVYIVMYLAENIKQVSKMITDAFGVAERHEVGNTLGDDAIKVGKNAFDFAKSTGKILWDSATGKKPEDKKEEGKTGDKKEENKEEKK
jgi:hypothetical protein